MDAQTFLKNFATIANAPEGVQRLRELVLRLAFRGMLSSHDGGEHPLQASLAAASSSQRPFPIPPQWAWATFADVTDSRLGKMLDKAKNTGPLRPYLRNANVQWFRFELSDVHELRLENGDLEAHTVRRGDLIICEGGEPGRVAICDESVEGMVIQKALHRSRPRPGVDPFFLAYLLRSYASSGYLSTFFTGATIKHLTGKALAAVPVPLPSHAEQERIVAKVDELLGLCDNLALSLERQEERASRFADAAASALVTG